MPITSLPPEILYSIHQHLMDSASPAPTTGQTPAVQQLAPPTSAQLAQRAAAARANIPAVSHLFYKLDKKNLSLSDNGDVGCLVTKNAIQNLAGEPAEKKFEERLRALFQGNTNIEVDFSTLSPEKAATVLRILRETVQVGTSVPLHNVKFPVNLDLEYATPELLLDIDATITVIRQTEKGKCASFEFACSSHDSARTAPPDFSSLANLTSVDLSGCSDLEAAPDFSNNLLLRTVNLSECFELTVAPDFSNNPELRTVNLSECSELTVAPDFSNNPELRTVDLSGCILLEVAPDFSQNRHLTSVDFSCTTLEAAPDFSNNPKLRSVDFSACPALSDPPDFKKNLELTSVNLSQCTSLTAAPDFMKNTKLTSVNLAGCVGLRAAPDFSNNLELTSVSLSDCHMLPAAPDFSNNPKLTSVDLSWCFGLTAAPVFSENLDLPSVRVNGYGLPTEIVATLRNLLGDRLIA